MRRFRRWYECISILKQKPDADEDKNLEFAYRAGWKAHQRIEKDFPACKVEEPDTYSDPRLDFDIGYHPDLYDAAQACVYEIKPEKWYRENIEYCGAQLSGYMHFKQARAGMFIIYSKDSYAGVILKNPTPWEELLEIAKRSDARLLEHESRTS